MESSQPENGLVMKDVMGNSNDKSAEASCKATRDNPINGSSPNDKDRTHCLQSNGEFPAPLSPMSPGTEAMLCEASIEAEEQQQHPTTALEGSDGVDDMKNNDKITDEKKASTNKDRNLEDSEKLGENDELTGKGCINGIVDKVDEIGNGEALLDNAGDNMDSPESVGDSILDESGEGADNDKTVDVSEDSPTDSGEKDSSHITCDKDLVTVNKDKTLIVGNCDGNDLNDDKEKGEILNGCGNNLKDSKSSDGDSSEKKSIDNVESGATNSLKGNSNLSCLSNKITSSKSDTGAEQSEKSSLPQQVFEDITEDEDSGDDDNLENIELELDDLIEPADLSKSNSSSGSDREREKDVDENQVPNSLISNSLEKDTVILRLDTGMSKERTSDTSANDKKGKLDDPKLATEISSKDTISLKSSDTENTNSVKSISSGVVPKKSKVTARKSGKPISQLANSAAAPLKTINLHPIKNVTMKVSEIERALDIGPPKELVSKSENLEKLKSAHNYADAALRMVAGLKKKRGRKNTYNFPGCKKKAKKMKLSDALGSSGSSAESVSYSDGDLLESERRKQLSQVPSPQHSKSAAGTGSLANDNSTLLYYLSKPSLPSTPSSQSSVSSSPAPAASTDSSKSKSPDNTSPPKGGVGKNKKMNNVLDMLHERNRLKVENVEPKIVSSDSVVTTVTTTTCGNSIITSSTTATTTTYIVSPPPNKPIIESNLKRKGTTPRKRRDDVICLSDSDDDVPSKTPTEGKKRKESPGTVPVLFPSTTSSTLGVANCGPLKPAVLGSPTQPPVFMVLAPGGSPPGLRSLLPRQSIPSSAPIIGNKIPVQLAPAPGMVSSFPILSPLPMGTKPMNMTNLPQGVVPLSLPAGTPQTMTFFTTTIPASQGVGPVPVSLAGTNFMSFPGSIQTSSSSPVQLKTKTIISSPSTQVTQVIPSTMLASPTFIATSSSASSKQSPPVAQVSSDSLRALLVGKNQTFAKVNMSSLMGSPQMMPMSSPPMFLQMVPTTAGNLITVASSPQVTLGSSALGTVKTSVSKSTPKASVLKPSFSLKSPHVSATPNGVSCLTPPKTPTSDEASEVAAAASLTRPIAGQVEDSEVIPLCSCKINGTSFKTLNAPVTYCQALDSVDNKVLGCCNKVTNAQLVRPGVKIPFLAVCEVHRRRMKLHQCCPGCGHFCSQGKFQQCRREGKSSVHNFHKQCMFYRGGKYYCPHCGEETSQCEVELKLGEDKKPEELKVSFRAKKESDRKTARILPDKNFIKSKSTNDSLLKSVKLANKSVTLDTALLGPDTQVLNRLNRCINEDRPKKYRTLAKDLYTPAYEGDMEKVFYLLVDGMDPNMRYEEQDDQTALHAAATSGHLGTLYLLQQFGGELHAQDKSLRTPMMCGAENGHVSIIQFLIKVGAKVEDRGEDGMTSLHYAAKAGYLDVIHHLLDTKKLEVNVQDDGGWTPIIWATESLLSDVVSYLLSQGGDPNKKDNEENTGLHWASYSGSLEIAEMFLDLSCEIDTPNEHGDRALHIAARQDHYDIVVLLLARGGDVNTKNNKDQTPLEACVNKAGSVWTSLKVNQQLRSFAARKLIQPEILLERDITMGREKNPIACVNAADSHPSPSDYLYVVENVETSPLNINCVITSLQSCRCKDDCSSMYCVCGRSSIKCWYDKGGRLLEEVNLMDPPLVFECNRACRCWVNCNNRVVQNGITCRLQLFKTNGRGWGVRTLMDVPKGTFVCEYIGELISDSEADRREDDSYLFDLDNKDGDTYCIDARRYGNISRFINHLCEPNLIPVKVFVEHQDLRFPRICFFASRDIAAYEELGFDYGEKFWIIKWKHFTCACQSAKCKYSSETIQKTLADYKARYPDENVDS